MRLTIATLTLALLASCGGPGDTSDKPTKPAPTTTTAATWSKEEAGQQYLKMVKPSNDASAKVGKMIEDDSTPYAAVAKACELVVTADDKFMRDLNTGNWPTDVKPQVQALAAEIAAARAGMQTCAQGKTFEDVNAGLIAAQQASKGSGQILRVALGLPGTK